ncbi:hypothetical protein bthur0005_61580 [Bacillus thuringiensis serovar pakistani str. T13001]|nr:hypothetical protein bthur0005_61580 [Bacillus thuringiensis serovar pakistani str. T13001]
MFYLSFISTKTVNGDKPYPVALRELKEKMYTTSCEKIFKQHH